MAVAPAASVAGQVASVAGLPVPGALLGLAAAPLGLAAALLGLAAVLAEPAGLSEFATHTQVCTTRACVPPDTTSPIDPSSEVSLNGELRTGTKAKQRNSKTSKRQ